VGLGFVCVPFSGRGACSVVITRPWIDAMGIYIMVGGATGWPGGPGPPKILVGWATVRLASPIIALYVR